MQRVLLAVLLVAAVRTVALLVTAELLTYALLVASALELVDAAQLAAVCLVLAARAFGGAIAAHCHVETQIQIAGTLIHWGGQSAAADVACSIVTAAPVTIELIRLIAAVVVAIADQLRIETLAEQTAMHLLWTLTLSALVVLIGCIAAIDAAIAFPAAGNTRSTAALEHASFTAGGFLATQLIRVVATIVVSVTYQGVVHALAIVASVLMGVAELCFIYNGYIYILI